MRPKGLPPDTQPVQRVLDWLTKHDEITPVSAFSPRVIARALRMHEDVVTLVLTNLERGKFVVREVRCFRSLRDEDPFL